MLTFDSINHKYFWVTGEGCTEIPSVTQIINSRFAPDFSNVPVQVLDKARRRGNRVHEICHIIDIGGEPDWSAVEPDIYDDTRNMVDAWVRFKEEKNVEIVASEEPSCIISCFSSGYRLAGTPDKAAKMKGKNSIIEIKTTSGQLGVNVGFQLIGYAVTMGFIGQTAALDAPIGLSAVRLDKQGKYHLWEMSNESRPILKENFKKIYDLYTYSKLSNKERRGMIRIR